MIAVGLVPSGRCAGPGEGLDAHIVQPPELTLEPGSGGRWGSEGPGNTGILGRLVPCSLKPRWTPAPSTRSF